MSAADAVAGAAATTGATASAPSVHCWLLKRNCAMHPRTFMLHIGALLLANLVTGLTFWAWGYPLVMLFALLQMAAVLLGALAYAAHATDGERIELAADRLTIECSHGGVQTFAALDPHWTRVELGGSSSPVLMRCGRTCIAVGRHLTVRQREAFCRDIRQSLAQVSAIQRAMR